MRTNVLFFARSAKSFGCIGMKIGLKGLREHLRNDNFQKSMQHNKAPHREIYDFFREDRKILTL